MFLNKAGYYLMDIKLYSTKGLPPKNDMTLNANARLVEASIKPIVQIRQHNDCLKSTLITPGFPVLGKASSFI